MSLNIAVDLHVDDGYRTRLAEKVKEVFVYLAGKLFRNSHPSLESETSLSMSELRVKGLDKYESSVLTVMRMTCGRPSTSPKLEKQTEPGDDDPCEQPELYRSAVCTILHMTKRRPDLQATARWLCKRLSWS